MPCFPHRIHRWKSSPHPLPRLGRPREAWLGPHIGQAQDGAHGNTGHLGGKSRLRHDGGPFMDVDGFMEDDFAA